MHQSIYKGFSLIELMVVIAIVGLLSAVAAPSYSQYVGRAKFAEVFSITGAQLQIWQEYNDLGSSLPANISNPSPYIALVAVTAANVQITLEADDLPIASDTIITYTPLISSNVLTWGCTWPNGTADLSAYLTNCTESV